MSHHIEDSRNSCALHGALQVYEAIEGVVPVIHSTSGCGVQHYLGGTRLSGGNAPFGSAPVSSTNIREKHVVFGGGSRLREQLKNSVKVVQGDLYAIVTGCSIEMVGDDVPAMAKEGLDQDWPVVYANTPGFRGDVHQGYQLAVRALIEQLPDIWKGASPAPAGLVNIWGIIPNQDPFWRGNLRELGRLLEAIGLVPNLLLGDGQDVESWKKVPGAAFNLAVSSWGELPARLLEERYGTPFISLAGLPVGTAAADLLYQLTGELGLDQPRIDAVIAREEARLSHQFARLADTYYRTGFQREFALIGESAQVVGIGEFLAKSLGLLPRLLVITDNPPDPVQKALVTRLNPIVPGYETDIIFSEDRAGIGASVRDSGAGIVLGSSLEQEAAEELGVPFLAVSFPLADRIVLDRGYAGYRGATALLEDLGSVILSDSYHQVV
ncbi:nitrogenase molybdenum-iron protein beta chain [Geobacter sp. OR-1]|uniref:nitrogenase component 1 n=1 Tax=Geobacter sp. OR-1 TaxID=1266765 RepID=UPI00054417DC|nr:nitrogenase component 1 [Geobacter sp. OR-1]GAM10275.1 nitrogenase molybdenum-iron protein beta chain [Geobacter sp. OR-1]